MTLIPAPTEQFIEKVKTKMRAEEIQNFSEDEIVRVFDYVVQSEACIRVVDHLINYQDFTIEQLYNDSEYKKYCISHSNPFGGDEKIKRVIYSNKDPSEILDNARRKLIIDCGTMNDCNLQVIDIS